MFPSIFHLLDLDHYNASVSLFVSSFSLKPADNDRAKKKERAGRKKSKVEELHWNHSQKKDGGCLSHFHWRLVRNNYVNALFRCVYLCTLPYLCVCALHLSLVPLSPPDIPLPVTAAWRFQIRPSSTFFLPVIALYAIQHQFHPTEINPTDNSLPPKWIMASPHFSTKTEVCGWKAVSVWRISTLSMGWSMWRSDSSLLLILCQSGLRYLVSMDQ